MENLIEVKAHETLLYQTLMDYDNKVTMSIVSIEPAFKLITDPDGKRAEFKERFQRECNYEDTPLQALQWLNQVANKRCHLPTNRKARTYARCVMIFDRIEKGIGSLSPVYHELKTKFFEAFVQMNELTKEDMLKLFEQKLGRQSVITAIRETVEIFADAFERPCLLDSVTEFKGWNRVAIYDLVETLRQHLYKLSVVQAACISLESNKEVRKQYFAELEEMLHGTLTKIANWLPRKLSKTWPHVSSSTAISKIPAYIDTSDPVIMNQTAAALQNTLDLMGPQEYVHTVMLMDLSYGDADYFVYNCDNTTCMELTTYQLKVVCYRYEVGQQIRIAMAHQWLVENSYRVQSTIAIQTRKKPDQYLVELFEKLQEKHPNITSTKLFSNALFLRKSMPWQPEILQQILIGYGIGRIGGKWPIGNVSYVDFQQPYDIGIQLFLHL